MTARTFKQACNAAPFSFIERCMDSPQNPDEWAALAKCVLTGDRKAAEPLADELGSRAFTFFQRVNGLSREDAEDLTQESVCHIILCLNQFDGANFTGWVYTILRHRLADHFRRHLLFVPLEDRDLNRPMPAASGNGSLEGPARDALEEALASLSSDDRNLIESRYGREPRPYEDIAKELGVSSGAARVRYMRALKKVDTFLRQDPRMQSWLARHDGSATTTIGPSIEHERPGE